jgi:hypothetical protein
MGFLIGLAAKLVGERFAPLLVYATMIAAVVGALVWFRNDAIADGRAIERDVWEQAIARAEAQADEVAGEVEDERKERASDWADRVREEKEKVDEAIKSGVDPFDAVFPAG